MQNALTAIIPIIPAYADALREKLENNPIDPAALDEVGTVHFARIFVFAPDNASGISQTSAAVITTYDGAFAPYIQDFVNQPSVAAFFVGFLEVVDDPAAKGLIPVTKNAAAFAAFVLKYDNTNPAKQPWGQWYSAYPKLTVIDIRKLEHG